MNPRHVHTIVFSFLLLIILPFASHAAESHVKAELLSEYQSIQSGKSFWVGLYLQAEPGWHTYSKDPGEAGFATQIQWTLPEGWTAGPIVWPAPQTFYTDSIKSFGYEGAVLLLTEIMPGSVGENPVTLKAAAKWLSCKDICLPGKADLELVLPVLDSIPQASSSKVLFDSTREHLSSAPNSSSQPINPYFLIGAGIGSTLVLVFIGVRMVKKRHAN